MIDNRNNGNKEKLKIQPKTLVTIAVVLLLINPILLFVVGLAAAVWWFMTNSGKAGADGENNAAAELKKAIEEAFGAERSGDKPQSASRGYKSTFDTVSVQQRCEAASREKESAAGKKADYERSNPKRSFFDDGLRVESVADDSGKYMTEYEEEKRTLDDLRKAGIVDDAEYRDRLAALKKR